jgi:alkylhydroperoxidase/carboxymuconolactone decarboxylase family protein YurZ
VPHDQLPEVVEEFARRYLGVWEAYNQLGHVTAAAGPLDERTQRLVKLALAVGAGLRGAVRSHTRRGLAAGLSRAEIEQVALLAVTTTGWPSAFAAFSWLSEVFAEQDSGPEK